MMAQKHLHELLREDQEPFQLKSYIADRRCQLKRAGPKPSSIQPKKRKPLIQSKQSCLFSFHDSPDVRKSPFLDLPSPVKSPCKNQNPVFLHIPARTAALLLDAALKIQKQSSKPKTQSKNIGLGIFGSILKRLKDKNNNKKREIGSTNVSVQEYSRVAHRKSTRESEKVQEIEGVNEKNVYEMGVSCSCNNSRLSSAGWSESNEEKSLDLETCSSSRSDDSEENINLPSLERENGGAFASYEKHFCSSPLSPFRFSLQRSPSPGRRTPDFLSPSASPNRHDKEEKEDCKEEENLQKIKLEEEEDTNQCSPVSVLEPPFEDEDDEEECHGGDEEGEEDDDYDHECSYAIMQRAKQQLLHKLRKFERLAELDPIELEKRMSEEYDDEDDEEEEVVDDDEEENADEFIRSEVFSKSSLCHLKKIPVDMKRLVLDLIVEEKKKEFENSNEAVVKRVCRRIDSWNEVESNTIDMMVELDLRKEIDGWNKHPEELRERAMEIELMIFGLMLEELSVELLSLA